MTARCPRHPARAPRLSVLAALLGLLVLAPARAQEPPQPAPPPTAPTSTARLAVASDPPGAAVVLFTTKDGSPARRGSPDVHEELLGRTPLDVATRPGRAEVAVLKEGYVLKVEPLDLVAGSAQRLEVRLARDVPIPGQLTFRDTAPAGAAPVARTQAQAEQLVEMVLARVVAYYVDDKDPRVLLDGAIRTLAGGLEAVRERETLLRRELGDEARARFYTEEVDLRAYPALALADTDLGHGRHRWSLAAGTVAVEGVTDEGEWESWRRKLHATYAFVKRWDKAGKLDDSVLAHALVEGVLSGLDDSHTHFLPPAQFKEMNDETSGHFGGVGIVVAAQEGHLVVVSPMAGTPGEKAGILAGDRILAIDDRPTDGMALGDAVKTMRGEPDTTLELTLRRGDGAPWKVRLTRARIAIKFVRSELLEAKGKSGPVKVGYVRLTSFMSEKLDEDFAAALDDLDAKGARALVLDLRNDPGGLLAKAVAIADMFVPEKELIVSTRGRVQAVTSEARATDAKKRARRPIAILVNEGSASASEVLAGTLREQGLALLVGEKSFGKGSVQRVIPLEPFESALALTVATYHFKSGFTPHKKGLVPDVLVALSEKERLEVAARSVYAAGHDSADRQLDAALAQVVQKLE